METIIEMSVGPWVPKPSTNANFEDKPVSAIGCECCQDLLEDVEAVITECALKSCQQSLV